METSTHCEPTVTFQIGNEELDKSKNSFYDRQNSTNEVRTYIGANIADDKSSHNGGNGVLFFRQPSIVNHFRPQYQRLQSAFNSNTVKYVFIISLVLNVVLFLSIIGIAFWKSGENGHGHYSSDKHSREDSKIACYSCGPAGIPGVTLLYRTSNGLCCINPNDNAFKLMIKKEMFPVSILSARYGTEAMKHVDCDKTKGNKTSYSPPKPIKTAALLNLDIKKTKKNSSLQWQTTSIDAFIIGDVIFSNNRLCLKKGGLVSIHSHFGLDTVSNQLVQKKKQFVTHYMFIHPKSGTPRIIAMNKETIQEDTYKSTDLKVSLLLRSNDCVSVYLSHPSIIYDMPISNIFQIESLD